MTLPDSLPAQGRERIKAARQAVADLCSGRREWTMSVPPRGDSDQDIVITDALCCAESALTRIAALEAENKKLRDMLASADGALSGCGCCASFTAREKWLSDYEALLSSPASEREGKTS